MRDIYKTSRQLELAFERLRTDAAISDADRAVLLSFLRDSQTNGLKPHRVIKYARVVRYLAKALPGSVREVTEESARELVRNLDSRADLSPWTRMDYKLVFRAYVKWLRKTDDVPPEIRFMRTHVKHSETKLPEDLLTPADVVALANATDNLRDRALIAVLYESGTRIGELLTMDIGAVRPDPNGAVLTVTGKTGPRRILIVESAPTLFAWMSVHPRVRDPRAPLWVSMSGPTKGQGLEYDAAIRVHQRASKRAGLAKRVHYHLFRHSRASFMANHMTEAQMNAYFGWIQGSDMPRVYVHLSGRDVDNAVLALHGLRRADAPTEQAAARPECPKCRATVLPAAVSCPRCWTPLIAQAVPNAPTQPEWGSVQQLMERLLQNPQILELVAEKQARMRRESKPPESV